eukprot:SAG11_NODE_24_length_24699_cov_10.132195_13_plen_723_part_00
MAVLDGSSSGESEAVVGALEALRAMSQESQTVTSADEVLVSELVLEYMIRDGWDGEVRVSASMAMFTLGCRNGFAVIGTVEFVERVCRCWPGVVQSCQAAAFDDPFVAVLASVHGAMLTLQNELSKMPPDSREPVFTGFIQSIGTLCGALSKCTDEESLSLVQRIHDGGKFELSDYALASGYCMVAVMFIGTHSGILTAAVNTGLVASCWHFYRRVYPTLPQTEWWSATAAVVDAVSAQLGSLFQMFALTARLPKGCAVLLEVWPLILAEVIEVVKMNQTARLSAGGTMSFIIFHSAAAVVEAAAKDDSQRPVLLRAGVTDALEFCCVHDFYCGGSSLGVRMGGALVELVGRNEVGTTLRQETVFAILSRVSDWFTENHFYFTFTPAITAPAVSRAATMAISDTNKRLMLEYEDIVPLLVNCLLVGSPRRGEKGGDAMQEAACELVLTLSLFEPWAEVLRVQGSGVVDGLRGVMADGAATEGAVHFAKQALFQLEPRQVEDDRSVQAAGGCAAKHVMVSYCWAQQPVIKRIHAALVKRGYAVWIDVEQMKGSTVDAMAAAVEGSEVMLMGVSRQYKESTNCRLEAQYAMQREVETVPLMLEEGYRADGWLGFMMGTRLWYGFYGSVVSCDEDGGLFEQKVSELCRELGDRGRTRKNVAMEHTHDKSDNRRQFLSSLTNKELRKKVKEAGVALERLEEAADSEDPKHALIELLVEVDPYFHTL